MRGRVTSCKTREVCENSQPDPTLILGKTPFNLVHLSTSTDRNFLNVLSSSSVFAHWLEFTLGLPTRQYVRSGRVPEREFAHLYVHMHRMIIIIERWDEYRNGSSK